MTLEQQQAIAMANARLRLQQGGEQAPQADAAQVAPTQDTSFKPDPNHPILGAASGLMAGQQVNVAPAGGRRIANTVKDIGLEGGGIALGQVIGAPFEEIGGIHALGAVGGALGSIAGQLTNFADPNQHFSWGRVASNAALGTIPGSFLAKPTVSLGTKMATMAGANMGATNLQSAIDTGSPASLGQNAVAALGGAAAPGLMKYLNAGNTVAQTAQTEGNAALKAATLKDARAAGLVFPPAAIKPDAVNNTLQSVAGKAATAQEAILRNQPVVNDIVRAETGIPNGTAITPESLLTAKVGPNLVYDEVSKMTPASAGLLANFKQASSDANSAWAAYRAAPIKDPALKAIAESHDVIAEKMQNALEKEAQRVKGGNDVMQRFDDARIRLAKIGLAGEALNQGSGDIDPAVIGRAFDRSPSRLTDGMKTIGAAHQAFGKYLKDAANTPPSGVDYLKFLAKAGAVVGGYHADGPTGALLGGAAAMGAEKGARNMILSPFYQQVMAKPYYGSRLPDFPASTAAFGTLGATR